MQYINTKINVWQHVMRSSLSWIQPHPHGTILRYLLNMVNSFLYYYTNYFKNRFLPNNLIIVRNHGDDEDDEWDIKRALERQKDAHIKVQIQSNSEVQSLTSSPNHISFKLMYRTHTKSDLDVLHMHGKRTR
jgi:hypothetical protein